MGKILITGGCGFIGSNTALELKNKGHEVVLIDNLTTGRFNLLTKPHFKFCDITDEYGLANVFNQNPDIDIVLHLAARCYVGDSFNDPLGYYWNNISGTITLLQVMKKHNVNKIVFASSSAVYGNSCNPISPYGYTKQVAEKIISTSGFDSINLRYFNVAGAYRVGEYKTKRVLPKLIHCACTNTQFNLMGDNYDTKDGTCVRDYVHIKDVVNANILAIEALRNGRCNIDLDIGTGFGTSILQLMRGVVDVTNKGINTKICEASKGDPHKVVAGTEKAKNFLGWKPRCTLKDIITSATEWYLEHGE